MSNNTYYVDSVGYEVQYTPGNDEMGELNPYQLYWHFNGFLLLGVF